MHPGDPDAMGCFARPGGGSVLVSNHELAGSDRFAVPHVKGLVYDTGGIGGTSTIVMDARQHRSRAVRLGRGHVEQLRRWRHAMGHLADL